MKRIFSLVLAVLLLPSIFACSEGLLPSLTDTFGVDMPSMAVYLEREPDEETTDESGTVTQVFYQVSENDFDGFNKYLEENGCSLADYSVSDNTVTETIEKQGKTFAFLFDSEQLTATFYFPAGSNPERYIPCFAETEIAENDYFSIEEGDIITFGTYEQDGDTTNGQEPIKWQVLRVEDKKMLLISYDILDYSEGAIAGQKWESSKSRSWLNSIFYNVAFTENEQENILKSQITADKNPRYTTNPGENTEDYIFLLSISEAKKYFSSFEERQCHNTNYAFQRAQALKKSFPESPDWWLRSPGQTEYDTSYVSPLGWISYEGIKRNPHYNYDPICGYRPALWVDINYSINNYRIERSSNSRVAQYEFHTDESADKSFKLGITPSLKKGDIALFGTYEQDNNIYNGEEPIEWIVLEVSNKKALMVSRYGLDVQPFNMEYKTLNWDTCSLRKWLNELFIDEAFSTEEKQILISDDYSEKETEDFIFLLSKEELADYLPIEEESYLRITPYCYEQQPDSVIGGTIVSGLVYDNSQVECNAPAWWLRSAGDEPDKKSCVFASRKLATVHGFGEPFSSSITNWNIVRPAMWISLED